MMDPLWKRKLKELLIREDVPLHDICEVAVRNEKLAEALNRLRSSAIIGDRPIRDPQHLLTLVGTNWVINWLAEQEAQEQRDGSTRAA